MMPVKYQKWSDEEYAAPPGEDVVNVLTPINGAIETSRRRDVLLAGHLGSRTAADLPYGQPPPQLVGELLTPEGPTVLYGPGGTGKGVTACWLILRLVRSGHVVMVLDFEGHEREWGSRLRGLGATDVELARIHYRAPFGADWTAPTGALADVADAVRADAALLAVTFMVVDRTRCPPPTATPWAGSRRHASTSPR